MPKGLGAREILPLRSPARKNRTQEKTGLLRLIS